MPKKRVKRVPQNDMELSMLLSSMRTKPVSRHAAHKGRGRPCEWCHIPHPKNKHLSHVMNPRGRQL